MESIEPKEIEIGFLEEENKENKISTTLMYRKLNKKFKEVIQEKKQKMEKEFNKFFRLVTTSVEYKAKLFYQRVKLIVEANRILVFDYNSQNTEDPTEIYNPLLILDFNQVTAGISLRPKVNKFSLLVLGSNYEFKFRAVNKEIFDVVIIYLNYYIEISEGYKTNLLGVSLRKDFYKNYYIFENDFRNRAKTGDLLIFRGFECPAKCQRCFTGAEYDHVALLHRKNDILHVYESTSKDGCMSRSWREFTNFLWNLLYDKMVYRELIIKMEDKQKRKFEFELQEKCDAFLKETEKKKYELSCCALCCARKRDYEKNNDWSKSKGFFCSQLVAAAYLKFNIIKYTKGTGYYLPGSFANDKTMHLNLEDNFSLGPEIIIDFSY